MNLRHAPALTALALLVAATGCNRHDTVGSESTDRSTYKDRSYDKSYDRTYNDKRYDYDAVWYSGDTYQPTGAKTYDRSSSRPMDKPTDPTYRPSNPQPSNTQRPYDYNTPRRP